MAVWDLSFGVFSEVRSHLNFEEKSWVLELGHAGFYLIDSTVNEPMGALIVADTPRCLYWT